MCRHHTYEEGADFILEEEEDLLLLEEEDLLRLEEEMFLLRFCDFPLGNNNNKN